MDLAGKRRRYRALGELGEGGTGTVYRVFDEIETREVAMKVLHADLDPRSASLAEEEFRLLASHAHPSLVEVFEIGRLSDGRRFFTMELLSGVRLLEFAESATSSELEEIVRQVLEALDSIHLRDVVHRDLKPDNILIVESAGRRCAKLIDFGLAQGRATSTNDIAGTVEYLAPELFAGHAANARSDLYALGVIWYELSLGRPPFSGDSAGEVVRAHREDEVPDTDSLPARHRETILGLLAKDPVDRPASAYDVLQDTFGDDHDRARSPAPSFASLFVGRERLIEELTTPSPESLVLIGPTGIGKSRILREASTRLQLEGRVIACEKGRGEVEQPGATLRRLVEKVAAEVDSDPKVVDRLDRCFRELERAEAAATGLEPFLEGFRFRVFSILCELAALRPIQLCVDDAHLADSLSLDALLFLARRIAEMHDDSRDVGLVLAARLDDESDRELVERFSSLGLPTRTIDGLSVDAVERILTRLLGDRDAIPHGFTESLHGSTGGNPLFLREYIELLATEGAFGRRGSSWSLDPDVELRVPSSLEEAAVQRIEPIADDSRAVLEALALAGEPLEAEDLHSLLRSRRGDLDLAETRERLDDHVRDQLLDRSRARYSFAHAALENAVYDSIPEGVRRERHRLHADWLESGERDVDPESLARHLYLSDEPSLARPHLVSSGTRALHAGALRDAANLLKRAIEVSASDEEKLEAHLLHEEVASLRGRREDQRRDLAALGPIADRIGVVAHRREVALREALLLDAIGQKREALERVDAALEGYEEIGPLEARLLSRRGMFLLFLAENEEASKTLDRALEVAESLGDRDLQATCLQLTGSNAYLQGRYDEALGHLERSLFLRRELQDDYRAGSLESNIGLIQFDRGLLSAAEVRFQSSLKCFRRIGVRTGEATNLVNLGLVFTHTGHFERALDYIGQSLEIRRELGSVREIGTDLGNLAEVWIRVGLPERAVPLLDEAIEIAERVENYLSLAINESRRATVDLARGDLDAANARFERSKELVDRVGGSSQRVSVSIALARRHLHSTAPEEALEVAESALALAGMAQMRKAAVECEALRARALLDIGRPADADEASRAAIAALEELPGWLDISQEVWFTHYCVLHALRARGHSDELPDDALRAAHDALTKKSAALQDGEIRRGFLENIPVHGEIERCYRELQEITRQEVVQRERSFYDIAKNLSSILEIDPLLDRLLELAISTTHAEKGLILLRESNGILTTRAAHGMALESVEDAAEICQSVIDDVASGGEPVLATDASSDDRFRARRSIISFQIRTLMCVPLTVRDEVLGAVYVDGRGAESFSGEDLEYLVSFAQLAAIAVDNARLLGKLRTENRNLRREVATRYQFENLVCQSAAMEQLAHVLDKIADTNASVLITGETGTGKSVIARALHFASPRCERPFVTVDCGALPENLLESELFGHKKGAFSGAVFDRVGLIEEAGGGTLFLDEITNTTLDLQAKLLRVLQEGEIRRVGENETRRVDVRIVAATNVSLREAVDEGRFREDLYYRLHVVPIEVPRLRDRREDIPTLAMYFLDRSCERMGKRIDGFTEDAMALLESAPWKGNVRELENTIEKIVILADDTRVDGSFLRSILDTSPRGPVEPSSDSPASDSPEAPPPNTANRIQFGATPGGTASFHDELPSLEEFDARWRESERTYLLELVESAEWNLSAAGRLARVRNRNTLVSRLKKHGIERPRDHPTT